MSLSLGRKEYFPEDNYAFASSTKETLVTDNAKTGTFKRVKRDAFIKHQLTSEEKKSLKRRIKEDEGWRIRTKKRKTGFQIGNTRALKKPLEAANETTHVAEDKNSSI